jgi:glycosyltransferase involved in cell wall biosynthesis
MRNKLKIAIGVHGRFHAFGLAAALLKLGHDVTVFSNYPAFAAKKFGIPPGRLRSFVLHGVIVRIAGKLSLCGRYDKFDVFLHKIFANWLARKLCAEQWDVTYTWSSVSKEYLKRERVAKVRLLARGSTHIRRQWEILQQERIRTGSNFTLPSEGIMRREECEYALADAIIVLSSFCKDSFLAAGVAKDKLRVMVSAVNVAEFVASPELLDTRRSRILGNRPLRVLNVGTLSHRKGATDFFNIADALSAHDFEFRFVGTVLDEVSSDAYKMRSRIQYIPRIAQSDLRVHYDWADIFLFTSIEEGLAGVIPQAFAAGLLVVATPNSGAADVVVDGVNGWILAARQPEAFIDKLNWLHMNRLSTASMIDGINDKSQPRDWLDAAYDFLEHSR